ncbi:MAG TPA: response regulator [Paenibacillus sp.]|uniref:response regulator transcription factor n=1 Tax=Paenibacillus sp. TaxID=58172 RepID=UPI002C4C311E|nr:response regulator [Paenibacillus sp.]HUC94261.1 response regulator [Paenibacillus sp.]
MSPILNKIMVVDDEAIQRRVLGKMIREVLPECEVVEASNGKAAMELVKTDSIEVVITDIKMPIMDGFGFIERMNKTAAGTKIIILSGFRYFEYAQRAVRLGAVDYLLKPVKEESIRRLLQEVAESIRTEKMQAMEHETIRRKLHSSQSVYYQHLLREWISNGLSGARLQELQGEFSFGGAGAVIVTKIGGAGTGDLSAARMQEMRNSMPAGLERQIGSGGRAVSFFPAENKRTMVTVLTAELPSEVSAGIRADGLDAYSRALSEQYGVPVTVGVGGIHGDFLSNAKISCKEAWEAADFRYFLKDENVIFHTGIAGRIKPLRCDFLKDEEVIKEHIRTMKREALSKYTEELFGRVVENGLPHPDQWAKAIVHMAYHIAPVIKDFVGDEDYERELADIERRLAACDDYADCRKQFLEILEQFMAFIDSSRTRKHEMIIEKCIAYIDSHYMEDLSLDEAARQLYFSSNYLSMLFKNHLGLTFTKYLSEVRLKKAVEMLENRDMKVYEIAAEIGYKDEKYFYRVFKTKFGVTPDEYRKQNKSIEAPFAGER